MCAGQGLARTSNRHIDQGSSKPLEPAHDGPGQMALQGAFPSDFSLLSGSTGIPASLWLRPGLKGISQLFNHMCMVLLDR